MPPDWTDLELDLRIDDESRYVDTAVQLSQVNAQVYSESDWHWRLLVAHSFGHAAAAETVKGVLAKLDAEGVAGEMQLREVREGRAEIVADVGPAGERPRGVPPAPLAVVARGRRPMARVLAVVPDLMLGSRSSRALGAAGHEVEVSRRPAGRARRATLLVADLDAVDAEARRGLGGAGARLLLPRRRRDEARRRGGRGRPGRAALEDGARAAGARRRPTRRRVRLTPADAFG